MVAMVLGAPETSWGLLEVDPDVAEPLPVAVLCEASLSSLC